MLVTELCPTLCDPLGFLGGSNGKEYASSVVDLDLIPGLGRSPGGGHGNPLWYSCLENLHRQKSLMDYSPWGHTESDTTEQLNAGSSVHGILQARKNIGVGSQFSSAGDFLDPGIESRSPALQADSLPSELGFKTWSF